MTTSSCPFSPKQLRQLVLQQQGLLKPFSGKDKVLSAVEQLGYVQIDSIYVVERAHHHVLYNRVKQYQPALLTKAVAKQQLFEYWSHAAAFLPLDDFRFSLQRKMPLRQGQSHWFQPEQQLMQHVLQRIRDEGPLLSGAFAEQKPQQGGWWNWQPAKQALEQLFMQGHLAVVRQDNFQKRYHLTEQLYPSSSEVSEPSAEEFADHLINRTLQSQAVATVGQMCYLRKNIKAVVQQRLKQRLAQAELGCFSLAGQLYYYATSLQVEQKVPNKVWLLSPFDNLVIQRDRLKQLFNFDYQIEVYVPAAKRKVGYYSLPILYRDQFIGQVDVKADRQTKTLLLQHLLLLPEARLTDALQQALQKAVWDYAQFNQCQQVRLVRAEPAVRDWLQKTLITAV